MGITGVVMPITATFTPPTVFTIYGGNSVVFAEIQGNFASRRAAATPRAETTTLVAASLVAETALDLLADPALVATVVGQILAERNSGTGEDPVVDGIDRARRQSLRLIHLLHVQGCSGTQLSGELRHHAPGSLPGQACGLTRKTTGTFPRHGEF